MPRTPQSRSANGFDNRALNPQASLTKQCLEHPKADRPTGLKPSFSFRASQELHSRKNQGSSQAGPGPKGTQRVLIVGPLRLGSREPVPLREQPFVIPERLGKRPAGEPCPRWAAEKPCHSATLLPHLAAAFLAKKAQGTRARALNPSFSD